jgi:hypothetical protein
MNIQKFSTAWRVRVMLLHGRPALLNSFFRPELLAPVRRKAAQLF